MDIVSTCNIKHAMMAVVLKTVEGTRLVTSWTEEVDYRCDLHEGLNRVECRFDSLRIRGGRRVVVELWLCEGCTIDRIIEAEAVDVVERPGSRFSSRSDQGNMLCDYAWRRLEDANEPVGRGV
jgi:hypothetical protein